MQELTLAMIKPHLLREYEDLAAVETILSYYRREGLRVVATRRFQFSKDLAEEFYHDHFGKPFFQGLVDEMTSGECIALLLQGEDAINKVRQINGATDSSQAEVGTIRHLYGHKKLCPQNAVHGSDGPKSAAQEIKLVFGDLTKFELNS